MVLATTNEDPNSDNETESRFLEWFDDELMDLEDDHPQLVFICHEMFNMLRKRRGFWGLARTPF